MKSATFKFHKGGVKSPSRSKTTSQPSVQTDEQLGVCAGGGCLASFNELVKRYEKRLFNFLLRRCQHISDAEDLTQNTFVEAWRSISRFSPKWRFSTWIYTIATRQSIHLYREKKKTQAVYSSDTLEEWVEQEDSPVNEMIKAEERTNLWKIAEAVLDEEQRSALWLRYVENLSITEIGQIIGRKTVSARVLLFRARQELKNHIDNSQQIHDNSIVGIDETAGMLLAMKSSVGNSQ